MLCALLRVYVLLASASAEGKSAAGVSALVGRARSQPDTSNLVLPSRRSGTQAPRLEPLRSVTRSSHDDSSESDDVSEARDRCSPHAARTAAAAARPTVAGAPVSSQPPPAGCSQTRGGRRSDPCSRTSSLIRQPAHSQALLRDLSSEHLASALAQRTRNGTLLTCYGSPVVDSVNNRIACRLLRCRSANSNQISAVIRELN